MPLIKLLKRNILLLATGFAVLAVSAAGMAVADKETQEPDTSGAKVSAPAGTAIGHATAETFEKRVLRSQGPVLVDFYADWCGPCRMQGAILKEFAPGYRKGKIIKINVDESPKLAAQYGVQGLPTLMLFQNGKAVGQHVGVATKEQLEAALLK